MLIGGGAERLPPLLFSPLPMLKSLDIDSELIFCGEIEMFVPSFPVLEELRMALIWSGGNQM